MLNIEFTVCPGQGEPSGFDLGDMALTGQEGTATSAGFVPDQSMMIFLSVTMLLDGLRAFLQGSSRVYVFTAVDSSFRLVFRRSKRGVSVAAAGGVVARATESEIAAAFTAAAESLAEQLPAEDAAAGDYFWTLGEFKACT